MKAPGENPAFVVTDYSGGVATEWRLARCPFCGDPFEGGPHEIPQHLEDHTPEDAGLDPLEAERRRRGKPTVAGGGRA